MKQKRITALIMVLLWCVSFFTPSSAVFAETLVDDASVQTATLTINYCLDDGTRNMIHEPYVAEQVVGSAYTVASPEIDGFRLKDEQQKTLTGTLQQDTTITVNYTYTEQKVPYTIVYEGYDPSKDTTVTLDTVTGYARLQTLKLLWSTESFGDMTKKMLTICTWSSQRTDRHLKRSRIYSKMIRILFSARKGRMFSRSLLMQVKT